MSKKTSAAKPRVDAASPVESSAQPNVAFAAVCAFVSGGSLMILEMVASRVLAPVYGNTFFVWTSVIGLILAALTVGYWVGGWIAERQPSASSVGWSSAAGAAFVAMIPLLSPHVLSRFGPEYDGITGTLIAASLLFLAPSILLGIISPLSVKLLFGRGVSVGRAAGAVSALGALGSIVGTFSAGYVLIPRFGTRAILLGVAVALALLAIAAFTLGRRRPAIRELVALVLIGGVGWASLMHEEHDSRDVFDQQTFYHRIRVRSELWDNRPANVLMLDTTVEGAIYTDGDGMPVDYTRYLDVADMFAPHLKSSAYIGGGSYAMPERFLKRHADGSATVFELDPVVSQVGKRFFKADKFPQIDDRIGDARRLLSASNDRFDLIFGDAYNGIRWIPFHLTTLEYYRLVHDHLRAGGLYMTNIIASLHGPESKFFAGTVRTLKEVFPEVYVFATSSRLDMAQNIVIACPVMPRHYTTGEVRGRGQLMGLGELTDTVVPLGEYQESLTSGQLLTDDYSPVEMLVNSGNPTVSWLAGW